jgi:glycosyltransferase involved in cell wall biosynthesis
MAKRLLFVEPFYGGSHRQFVDALRARSSWEIEVVTMPARFWRWRRRLSAFEIARRMREQRLSPEAFDLVVVGDYVDIGDLKALWGTSTRRPLPPIFWYCHETQSTYPLPKGETVAADLVATDMRNALHADSIAFNSAFHRDAFLKVYRSHARLLHRWEPEWEMESVEHKTRVVYPGIECPDNGTPAAAPAAAPGAGPKAGGPIILWNHRWEYDKNFGAFFQVVSRLAKKGLPFRLAILGENPQAKPQTFLRARTELADRLVAFGYARDPETYRRWLVESDIVISTAIQENFGIAVLEAMSEGCIPLLPRRLTYPEIVPESLHEICLYDGQAELEEKLRALIRAVSSIREPRTARGLPLRQAVTEAARRYCWDRQIIRFDAWFEEINKPVDT